VIPDVPWALEGEKFGHDVKAWAMALRFGHAMTHRRVSQTLTRLGIPISRSTVGKIEKQYMALMWEQLPPEKLEEMKGLSHIYLTVDGTRLPKENIWVYDILEYSTGTVISSRHFESRKTSDFVEWMTEVRTRLEGHGIKVDAWITDFEKAEVRAIETVFPDLVIQLCDPHFNKANLKPGIKADKKLSRALARRVGKISQYIAFKTNPENLGCGPTRATCEAINRAISIPSKYHDTLRGILRYEHLRKVHDHLNMLITGPTSRCLESDPEEHTNLTSILSELQGILLEFEKTYDDITFFRQFCLMVRLLNRDESLTPEKYEAEYEKLTRQAGKIAEKARLNPFLRSLFTKTVKRMKHWGCHRGAHLKKRAGANQQQA